MAGKILNNLKPMQDYQKPIKQIFQELKTNQEGLSNYDAFSHLKQFGLNQLKTIKKTPLYLKFFYQFKDLLALILIAAGVLALIMQEPRDAGIIFTIVIINAIIGFSQEYRAEKLLSALKKHLPSFSKVVRDDKLCQVLTINLVPGDILALEAGDNVGADARLIEAFDLKTNDFALTGESHSQTKKVYDLKEERRVTDIDNMVFMGTSIAEGRGKAIVVKTGMQAEFGKIAETSQKVKEEPTPLQKELTHTGKTIGKIAVAVGFFVLFLLYILGKDFKECVLFAIAAGAAMVPEGLPAATSVALSIGAQKMLKKNALVKKLLHVESLGSVTTICSDKTGTLTTGLMTVKTTYPDISNFSPDDQKLFLESFGLCNNAELDHQATGDSLEIALLEHLQKLNLNYQKIRQQFPKIYEIPFSSQRKMMSIICSKPDGQYLLTKGAPLELLEKCQIEPLDKKQIIQKTDELAKTGLRIIAIAYKKISKPLTILKNQQVNEKDLETDLKFLGLIALEDPPREGVKKSIEICHQAKIKIIMITGDYGLTALSIAREIGLVKNSPHIVTGEDLHQMDDEKLKKILTHEIIFVRTEPTQKLRIVQNLQEMGEVVAVTGDGVNDAPALVKADIGIAMGKTGTEVAKEASDMILLDDDFSTIINAIKEGRRIFDNTRKFVFYVLSSNSGELVAPLLGILLGLPLPLLAIQILAIDLGTDVLPSLALGVEKEEPNIMLEPPKSKEVRIMNINILWRLLGIGMLMGILGIIVFLLTLYFGGWHLGQELPYTSRLYFQATAAVYTVIVFCQIANAFSCRSEKIKALKLGLFTNPWLWYAEIVSFILLFGVIGFSPLQEIFKTSFPPYQAWIFVPFAFIIFFIFAEWLKQKVSQKMKSSNELKSI